LGIGDAARVQTLYLSSRSSVSTKISSPHAGIAPPLNLDHFARLDINFEWTARLWESIFGEHNNIVARL